MKIVSKYILRPQKVNFPIKFWGVFIASVVVFLFLGSNRTFAQVQQSIQISPIIQDLHLVKGQSTTYQITIRNLSQASLGVHVGLSDFIDQDSDTPSDIPTLARWTSIAPSDITLDPNTLKTVTVSINTPLSAQDGSLYTGILFTPFAHQEQVRGKPIILSQFIGLLIATIGNPDYTQILKNTSLSDVHFSQVFFDTNQVTMLFQIKNQGANHFAAKPFLSITPLFGKEQTIQLTEKHILPHRIKYWDESFIVKNPLHIFYKAHVAVSVGQGNYVYADCFFFIFPLKNISIGLVSLLLVFFFAKYHKRVRKALLILLRG